MSLASQIGLLATSVGTTIKALTARVTALEANTIPANPQSGTTYTNVAGDCGKEIQMTNTSANTCYIDASVAAAGKYLFVRQAGTGQTTIAFISGTTYVKSGLTLKTAGKGSCIAVRFDSTSFVYIDGGMAAS
jgi:hypothetical protein